MKQQTNRDQKQLGTMRLNIADTLCGAINTDDFDMMRRVMEQTASFFGYDKWEECIKSDADDPNGTVYKRVIDLMSHGDYSLYEPREMMQENKDHFRRVLRQFISLHPFSPTLFPEDIPPLPEGR